MLVEPCVTQNVFIFLQVRVFPLNIFFSSPHKLHSSLDLISEVFAVPMSQGTFLDSSHSAGFRFLCWAWGAPVDGDEWGPNFVICPPRTSEGPVPFVQDVVPYLAVLCQPSLRLQGSALFSFSFFCYLPLAGKS
jgi:hypothetical protein